MNLDNHSLCIKTVPAFWPSIFSFAEKLLHSDLDQRALDALKEFPPDSALGVLAAFLESNLKHVSNKSAYLCDVMKTYQLSKGAILTICQGGNVDNLNIQVKSLNILKGFKSTWLFLILFLGFKPQENVC